MKIMRNLLLGIILITITTTSCAPMTPDQQERLFLASTALMSIGNTLQQQEAINQYNQQNNCEYNRQLSLQQDQQMNYYQQQSQMNHTLQLMMLNQIR